MKTEFSERSKETYDISTMHVKRAMYRFAVFQTLPLKSHKTGTMRDATQLSSAGRATRATSVKNQACFRFYRISGIVLCKSVETEKERGEIPPHNISDVHTTRRYHANVFGKRIYGGRTEEKS